MQRHVESNAYNSIGLNEILSFTGPVKASDAEGHARELDWRRTMYRVQLAVVLLLVIAVLRRRSRWPEDAPATRAGDPLLFCTLSLAAYYYAFLILLVLAHAQSAWRIASLFGAEVATGVLGIFESNPIVLFFYRNVLVAFLLIALYLGRASRALELRAAPQRVGGTDHEQRRSERESRRGRHRRHGGGQAEALAQDARVLVVRGPVASPHQDEVAVGRRQGGVHCWLVV